MSCDCILQQANVFKSASQPSASAPAPHFTLTEDCTLASDATASTQQTASNTVRITPEERATFLEVLNELDKVSKVRLVVHIALGGGGGKCREWIAVVAVSKLARQLAKHYLFVMLCRRVVVLPIDGGSLKLWQVEAFGRSLQLHCIGLRHYTRIGVTALSTLLYPAWAVYFFELHSILLAYLYLLPSKLVSCAI